MSKWLKMGLAIFVAATITGGTAGNAWAAKNNEKNMFSQMAVQKKGIVNFSITVAKNLSKKEANVVYNVSSFGSDKAMTQNNVNHIIEKIRKNLPDKAKVETLNRTTYQLMEGARSGWETTQTEKVIAKADLVGEIVAAIENGGGQIVSTQYELSDKEKEKLKEEAQKEAVKKWLEEAEKLSKLMHAKEWWVNSMNITLSSEFGRIRPLMYKAMSMEADEAVSRPMITGGEEKVRVQVMGSIQVKF